MKLLLVTFMIVLVCVSGLYINHCKLSYICHILTLLIIIELINFQAHKMKHSKCVVQHVNQHVEMNTQSVVY